MANLAEIVRTFGPDYCALHGDRMPPSHQRALNDIVACRTEVFGGHLAQCDHCGHQHYSYHSCRNRSCPTCHAGDRQRWLDKRQAQLLPIPYYHVVFTLPEELRWIVRRQQKPLYATLFQAAAEALQTLCADVRYVGGDIGILAVLHTWTRQLVFHPHVHCLVTGGGLTQNGQWLAARKKYLVPVTALSQIFRAKFMALARIACPEESFPESLWEKDWVVYCKPAVQGSKKLLDYLGRYVHGIAISNRRILRVHQGQVTFEYKDSRDNHWKTQQCPARSSCAACSSMCSPGAFTKCGITDCSARATHPGCDRRNGGCPFSRRKNRLKQTPLPASPTTTNSPWIAPTAQKGSWWLSVASAVPLVVHRDDGMNNEKRSSKQQTEHWGRGRNAPRAEEKPETQRNTGRFRANFFVRTEGSAGFNIAKQRYCR